MHSVNIFSVMCGAEVVTVYSYLGQMLHLSLDGGETFKVNISVDVFVEKVSLATPPIEFVPSGSIQTVHTLDLASRTSSISSSFPLMDCLTKTFRALSQSMRHRI